MTTPTKPALPRRAAVEATRPLRAGLVCDFLEEGWPSMDLFGEMLPRYLGMSPDVAIIADPLRPQFQRRFSRIGRNASLRNADRLVNRFADYPCWLRKRNNLYDVFHLVDHSYAQLVHALPADRTVVTCHDLDTFRCLLEPEREKRPGWFRGMTRRSLTGFQKAAHVIAVSCATRDELLEHRLIPSDRISVIPNGVHPSCSPLPDAAADAKLSALLGNTGDAPLLLSVGSTAPRKRLDVLLRIFAAVRRDFPSAQLLRVGGLVAEHRNLARELGILEGITEMPFLHRETLAATYRRAALLLQTSSAEGFGLPLIEAMACGCPVMASDIPVLREVGGSAASYCQTGDMSVWKDAVLKMLEERAEQPAVWAVRRQLSLDHAAHFSWPENARATATIYRKIADQAQLKRVHG